MITIVDYGVGNLFSLCASLKFIGEAVDVTSSAEKLSMAEKIILPGVGAFGDAADKLKATGLISVLDKKVKDGTPLLGICLGMQLLFEESEEYGLHKGLGFLKGKVLPLSDIPEIASAKLKIPAIGWNALHLNEPQNPLMKYVKEGDFVYYVHSYYARCNAENLVASSEYGAYVTGAVANENVLGVQFHPEKSGKVGLNILRAFAELE